MSSTRSYPQPPVTGFSQFDEDYEDSSDYDSDEDDYDDDESEEEEPQQVVAPPAPRVVAPPPPPVPTVQEVVPPPSPAVVIDHQETGNHSDNYDMTEYSNYDAPHIIPVSHSNSKGDHETAETVEADSQADSSNQGEELKHSVPSSLLSTPYARGLQVALELALQAGKSLKAGGANERHIQQGLQKAFPQHRIIGKEDVGKSVVPMLTQVYPTWFIDATNGATSGSLPSPMSCVSIGMCLKGQPVIGVVFNPFTNEMFVAADGFGAFLNGEKIQVTQAAVGLASAVVGYEFGKGKEKYKMLNAVGRIMEHGCEATRSLGSVPMNLCYVASGRMHGTYAGIVPSEGWKPWDFCAGLVIVKEAGCRVSAIRSYGNKDQYDMYCGSIICAANASLVSEIGHCISQ